MSCACKDWLDLPVGECYQEFRIAREPNSWPEGWKEPTP